MERFHSNVGSFQAALQERPEVLHTVGVYATIYVLNGMIYDLVQELIMQTFVPAHLVSEKRGSSFDVFTDDGLQGFLLPIWNHKSADVAATLQKSSRRCGPNFTETLYLTKRGI